MSRKTPWTVLIVLLTTVLALAGCRGRVRAVATPAHAAATPTPAISRAGTGTPDTPIAGATSAAPPRARHAPAAGPNPIVVENEREGSTDWQNGRPGYQVADDKEGQIKGYAGATSVNIGQSIAFHVSVNPAQKFTVDVYRMGWYGGKGGRLMLHAGPLNGTRQPACPLDVTTGMIACAWSASYVLKVPASGWTSGVYMAMLTNERNYQNRIIFVVRDDARPAGLLYQQPVLTYQAYNNYPDDKVNGKSLYNFNSNGPKTIGGAAGAVKVSFDRPYSNDGNGLFMNWELFFVHWLERSGYDVTYSTNVDTHANGERLLDHQAFISVGHDEYWTTAMYDAAEYARDHGVSLGFFGGDDLGWQVRLEPSASGTPNRVEVCYRDYTQDPEADLNLKSTLWNGYPVLRAAQGLLGVELAGAVRHGETVPFIITNSSHWVYAGTGFKDGDRVPGIMGYEGDRYFPDSRQPPGSGYTVLSNSPFIDDDNKANWGNSTIYQAPSGAWVFAAGTMSWAWALDQKGYVDWRIQQETENILNAFLTGVPGTTARVRTR